MKIKFNSIISVINFSDFCRTELRHSDINVSSGNIFIDAKSILGLTFLDISKAYEVEIITTSQEEKDKLFAYLEPLAIKNKKGGN